MLSMPSESDFEKTLLSKEGNDIKANTPPVFGSKAIAAALLLPIA